MTLSALLCQAVEKCRSQNHTESQRRYRIIVLFQTHPTTAFDAFDASDLHPTTVNLTLAHIDMLILVIGIFDTTINVSKAMSQ